MLRSWLFVPGDSERKLEKAATNEADALLLDLEDAVTSERKPEARARIADYLDARRGSRQQLWVRVNGLDTGELEADFRTLVGHSPAGFCVPKIEGAEDLRRVDELLTLREAEAGLEPNSVRLLTIAMETPRAVLAASSFLSASVPRLEAMTWGSEDLASGLGATTNREPDGEFAPPYRWARTSCLMVARALGVAPIASVWTDFRNLEGLEAECRRDRASGFVGKLAIHPAQPAIIHPAFAPTEAELERARRIVELFADNPDAGAIGLDGEMLDRPHLVSARRMLEIADSPPGSSSVDPKV